MPYEEPLPRLLRRLGLPPDPSTASGPYGLTLDRDLHLDIWHAHPAAPLWIRARLGQVRPGHRSALYRLVLRANLSLPEGRDDHFAIDAPLETVALCRPLGMPSPGTDRVIEEILSLAELARTWRQLLAADDLISH